MKAVRDRDQVSVALIGTLIAMAVVLTSMNLGKLPFLHPATAYAADFEDADGLRSGDDVRVLGISVGSVTSVRIQRDHVHVRFTVKKGLALGDQSRASIEMATVLGQLFLQVESAGTDTLRAGSTIPVSRTTVPYTVVAALQSLGTFAEKTDVPALRQSLSTLASAIKGISPDDASAALKGLANISQTVAAKQSQINQILEAADAITATLNTNSSALTNLLTDSDAFLKLVQQRRDAIASLLRDTDLLGRQLQTAMSRNGAQLAPMLANLKSVSAVLAKEKGVLQQATDSLGQFSVNIANATGAGPWLDLYAPVALIPDNVIVGCGAHPNTRNGPCG